MRALILSSAALLSACLSTPARPADDGGAIDGAGGDGAMTFPDAGPVVPWDSPRIRYQTPVADIDGDGVDDAVFANSCTTCGDGAGIYIAFGRPEGFFTGFDQVLAIESLEPLFVHVGDFVGDGRLDILLLAEGSGNTWIVRWEQTGYREFESTANQLEESIDCGAVDSAVPCFVTTARITGNNKGDVLFGDLTQLHIMRLSEGGDDFASANALPLPPPDDPWGDLSIVYAMPSSMSGVDDLLVATEHDVLWYPHSVDDDVGFPPDELLLSRGGVRGFVQLDLDGDEALDLFTTVVTDDSEFVVVAPPTGDSSDMQLFSLDDTPADNCAACDPVEHYAVVQADSDTRPDLVLMDLTVGEGTQLSVVPNLSADQVGTVVNSEQNPVVEWAPELPAPRRLIAGDFDGDEVVEVWVFDSRLQAGNTRCFELRQASPAGIAIADCP